MNYELTHTRKECATNLCVLVTYVRKISKLVMGVRSRLMTAAQPSHKIQLKITFLDSPSSSPPMNVMIEELSVSGVMDAFLFAWFSSADHAPKETEDNSTFGNQWKFVWSPDLPKKDLFLTRYDKELQHYRRVGFLTLYAQYPDKLANDMGELLSNNVGRDFFQDPRLSFQQFLQTLQEE